MTIESRLETAEQALARGATIEAQAVLLELWEHAEPALSARALRGLAVAAQRLGNLEEAELWLSRAAPLALETDARIDVGFARLANALAAKNAVRIEQQNRDLAELVTEPSAFATWAGVLASHGLTALALEKLAKAGDLPDAQYGAAMIHAGGQKFDEAERLLQLALPRTEGELATTIQLALGDVQLEQQKPDMAEASYRAAQKAAPARALLRLAALHVRAGNLAKAETEYSSAIDALPAHDPAIPAVLDELASLYARAGRVEVAQATLERAVDLTATSRPEDPALEAHLRMRLGTLLLSGETADPRAIAELQQAAIVVGQHLGERHPMMAGVLNTLALAQVKSGQTADAEATARRSMSLVESPHAFNTLAIIEVTKGNPAAARVAWEQARTLFEKAGLVDEARGVAENLAALPK
jgi:tetratricopeptide (TPR) repeat protein